MGSNGGLYTGGDRASGGGAAAACSLLRGGYEASSHSDSQSDCTGRTSSLGSREDLTELAHNLGLASAECLAQERFKVDRKGLELLIFGNENNPDAAAQFFDNIMQDTRTHIIWPSKLKLGAKSKKDPHIRVIGRSTDVKIAKNRIMANLDTRASRVNMKIDVSYTDHSHIIGKGGFTIRRVMEETGCHIHFPDSNRNNALEKSNQVSIAGEIQGVERARASVRELTPLIFCFELPILGAHSLTPDPPTPFIKSLQDEYNVQVTFRTRQKLNSTLVVVKGCDWEVTRVKEATLLLINHMCESLASQVLVHMMMEISPAHHSLVLGRNNENLKGIKLRTNTQIVFQDANDPNIPSLKKSNVVITGSIHNVYIARQQLIGSLPVVLMFDAPENSVSLDQQLNTQLMQKYDIVITTRLKPKQNILSFILKGIERNVGNLYEARRKLIAPNEKPVEVTIPVLYTNPSPTPIFSSQYKSPPDQFVYPNLPSPGVTMGLLRGAPGGEAGPGWHHHPHPVMQFQLLPHIAYQALLPPPAATGAAPPHPHPLQPPQPTHFSYSSLSLPDLPAVYSSLSSNTSSISSPSVSPRTISPVPNSAADQKLDHLRPDSIAPFNTLCERKAPGFERPVLSSEEYQKMKLQALTSMQKPPKTNHLRTPTSIWSGYGFSQSSPSDVLKEQKTLPSDERLREQFSKVDEDLWCDHNSQPEDSSTCSDSLSASNYLDSASSSAFATICNSNFQDLQTLLALLGLEKYYRLFESHEIDISTFKTLTEGDLKEIGVTAFGARRKFLLCIAEMKKRQRSPFRGSAAPGAERMSSSTNSLNDPW